MEKNNFMKATKEDNYKGGSDMIPTVLVTGFGPFRNHSENSSWLTVKELLNLNITDYNLIAKELPVEYEFVSKGVPELWEKFKPKLVVHCGMSELAKCVTLEKVAHNEEYIGCDVKGQVPMQNCCCENGPKQLSTAIDVDAVLEDLDATGVCVKAVSSENAGRYLCEYIFYTSLKINRNTAFVHVPPINQPYSARAMAQALSIIISSMLKQIKNS
ncbi:pyroglutamyl-peptidase 1 [Trichonephila clavata]|uniref:Pyroglutamyl-peptidase 1 n=1 Tax=Trichonephila clavata TaxID=2740835 RepID=A0A8X6GP53_TRICU|nr:pyroglutamyl-peptidase 1 [Trichonephila clavata]